MSRIKIKPEQLEHLESDCREIIRAYKAKKKLSHYAFCKLCAVHPNQMTLFLKGHSGINITTMQKVGKIIAKG